MNIEKLAKHLKEFTLDEIEMIAECDCKTELEHLLNDGKIAFEQGLYKYQEEKPKQEFIICTKQTTNYRIISIDFAIDYFDVVRFLLRIPHIVQRQINRRNQF